MRRNKRSKLLLAEPQLWQRAVAGEHLARGYFPPKSKCEGIVEDHRPIALDVRELIRKRVFEQPLGSTFRPSLAYPWLRVMRLKADSLCLELNGGRLVIVPLVWADCGVMGAQMPANALLSLRFAAVAADPLCGGKLGDYGQLWAAMYPPKPRGMWRRTYARYRASLERIERKMGGRV